MCTPAAITTIRTRHGVVFGTHKMPAARTTVATTAKNSDVIYKI